MSSCHAPVIVGMDISCIAIVAVGVIMPHSICILSIAIISTILCLQVSVSGSLVSFILFIFANTIPLYFLHVTAS